MISFSKARIFSIILLSQYLSTPLSAKPKQPLKPAAVLTIPDDVCTFEAITDRCNLINPQGVEKIELADGTVIPNFSAILRLDKDKKLADQLTQGQRSGSAKNDVEYVKVKQRLISLMSEVDDRIFHPKFKFFVSENFLEMLDFLAERNGSLSGEMTLPWPPENPLEPKLVRRQEVLIRFFSLFNGAQREKLQLIERQMRLVLNNAHNSREVADFDEGMKDISKERIAYVEKLIDYAKLQIISVIVKGKPERSWTEEEKRLAQKLKSIRVTPIDDPDVAKNPHCTSLLPNGFYAPLNHSINICPKVYRLPDTAVLAVVAHELAHAVDPCNSQFGTYEIRQDKMLPLAKGLIGGLSNAVTKTDDRLVLYLILSNIVERSNRTAMRVNLITSPQTLQFFKDKGILVSEVAGVPFAKYSLKDIYDCLKTQHGFRGFDEVAIRKIASEVTVSRKQYRGTDYDPKADEKEIIDAYQAYPECMDSEKHSQMGEAMADWISATVVGEFIKGQGQSLKTPIERLSPISVFANLVCMDRFQAGKEKDKYVAAVLAGVRRDHTALSDSHPGSKDRIDKIFLLDPNIRKAMGCSVTPAQACVHR